MNAEQLTGLLRYALLGLGVLFVVVNTRVASELVHWVRRRRKAILVWPSRKPPYYSVSLAIGVALGILLFVTVFVVPRPATSVFGVSMMFAYYGYLLPLSTRIGRGLYEDGIWTDSGFMPYIDIGGLSWKTAEVETLILASRTRSLARRLLVPGPHLGEVRRLLREKIGTRAIEVGNGPGLHLGGRDARESV
jgi:hypothetical protein